MKVLIIKTGALGDVLRTTALLPALKRLYPEAETTWVTAPAALPLLEHNPLIDRLTQLDGARAAWHTDVYDWVLSLDEEPATCHLASGMKAHCLSGAYAAADATLRYTDDMAEWFVMGLLRPESEGGLARANELKRENRRPYSNILYECLKLPLPVHRPQIFVPAEARRSVQEWVAGTTLAAYSEVVGLNTGAGGRWALKKWGEEQTAALAMELNRRFNVGVVILGGEQEKERNQRIEKIADGLCVAAPTDWGLKCFSALVGICRVIITSDSLALHVAVANGVPVVGFFGPTSAAEIDLFGRGRKVVTPLSCRCCYLTSCDVRPHCMESIEVRDLLAATSDWLS
jgi:ADP-heptose:LPS heptosyltransferase